MKERTANGVPAHSALAKVCTRCFNAAQDRLKASPEQDTGAGEMAIQTCMVCAKPCQAGKDVASLYDDPLAGFEPVEWQGIPRKQITCVHAHGISGAITGVREILDVIDSPSHRLEVLRNGRVFAIRASDTGKYHLLLRKGSKKSNFTMSNRALVKLLLELFAEKGANKALIPAWAVGKVLFFGEKEGAK